MPAQPAARQSDQTAHGGLIVVGEPTVLIGGQMAARLGDNQACPQATPGGVPHVGGAITTSSATVLIGGALAARLGDSCDCVFGPDAPPGMKGIPNVIVSGEPTVLIG